MNIYEVISCPSNELSYTNRAIINARDNFQNIDHIIIRNLNSTEAFVFSLLTSDKVGPNQIAFNLSGRKWASLQTGTKLEAAPYEFEASQCLGSIAFYVDFATKKPGNNKINLDTDDMAKQFSFKFVNQAFTVGQIIGFAYEKDGRNVILELRVKELGSLTAAATVEIGLANANTLATFEPAEGSEVNLLGDATGKMSAPTILDPNWNFAALGIGGLSEQFNEIFQRAFTSRLLPPIFAAKLDQRHVKGIILYGPPGTGKTLLARQIGKMLHTREPKVVNGPEVLNKFVGESEANIRRLFEDAEKEEKSAGINSGLHMIIFDEIDAICKARSSNSSSAGAGDNVVNQLLSKIDGVNALNNVLLIGMTNRIDLLDPALLRPGRFELQIEIGLPDEAGRLEIFKIHTQKMREAGFVADDVNLEELARVTKNYTGAEISGLINAAKACAYDRMFEKDDLNVKLNQDLLQTTQVTGKDFEIALKKIKPAFGADDDKIKLYTRPIVHFNETINSILYECKSEVNIVKKIPFREGANNGLTRSILLRGARGSGLTTLANHVASDGEIPLTRFYRSSIFFGMTEVAKVQLLTKIFDDASKSQLSCIIFDDIDRIIEYNSNGPRFSNSLLLVFQECINQCIPKNHGLLIICTTTSTLFLKDLDFASFFDTQILVPSISDASHVNRLLATLDVFTSRQREEIVNELKRRVFQVGVKHIFNYALKSSEIEPENRVYKFLECIDNTKLN